MDAIGYLHERNFGCRINEYTYRGLKTVFMENELLRIGILADKGTDIFEFLHKPTDTDFMWRSYLGVRRFANYILTSPPSNGPWLDYYEGGWQECLPNAGNFCLYRGSEQGHHGEVDLIPWQYRIVTDSPEEISVVFSVRTSRSPYFLQKTLTLRSNQPVLWIEEKLTNEGDEDLELMWVHHPAFGPPFLGPECVVDVPDCTIVTMDGYLGDTDRLRKGQKCEWPFAAGRHGGQIDLSKIGGPELRSHDVCFLEGFDEGWYALTNTQTQVGFGMRWSTDVFPYIWYWQPFRGAMGSPWYGRNYNVALEPASSYPPTLSEAVKAGTALRLAARESMETELLAVAYSGSKRVTHIDASGQVTPR